MQARHRSAYLTAMSAFNSSYRRQEETLPRQWEPLHGGAHPMQRFLMTAVLNDQFQGPPGVVCQRW
jgi:hypothetical protein